MFLLVACHLQVPAKSSTVRAPVYLTNSSSESHFCSYSLSVDSSSEIVMSFSEVTFNKAELRVYNGNSTHGQLLATVNGN